MKKYEKPIAEFLDFCILEAMMDEEDQDPSLSGGVEDW